METNKIREDLLMSLKNIDNNNYILNSMITHLEEQCSEEEVKLVEDQIYDLATSDYESQEYFIADYQPIFDLVEFPISECFRMMNKRKLNYDAL